MSETPGTDPVPSPQNEGEDETQRQFMARFLDLQEQELQLKAHQLEFDRQKDANALDYGKAALDAQERDRKDTRQCSRDEKRDTLRTVIWIAIIVAFLIGLALYLDKDEAAMEIIKALIFLTAGVAAGAGWEKRKKRNSDSEQDEG